MKLQILFSALIVLLLVNTPNSFSELELFTNSKGDLTVACIGRDEFYIVTGTGFATHDYAWIAQHIPPGLDARLADVTDDYAVFSLMGPRARDVLAAVCNDDLANDAFPFGHWRRVTIEGAHVRAMRITYVGELGWELHVPGASAKLSSNYT